MMRKEDWNKSRLCYPDEHKPLLIRTMNGEYHSASFMLYGREGFFRSKDRTFSIWEVTHWMYIVEPDTNN